MLKIGLILGMLAAALGLVATNLPDDALHLVNSWIHDESERAAVSQSDKVLTNITRVNVVVGESYPMRLSLEVEGEHPDGCDYPVLVAQARRGDEIHVEVYREVPADVFCPMILQPYHGTIHIEGGFETGAYAVQVNSHSQVIQI